MPLPVVQALRSRSVFTRSPFLRSPPSRFRRYPSATGTLKVEYISIYQVTFGTSLLHRRTIENFQGYATHPGRFTFGFIEPGGFSAAFSSRADIRGIRNHCWWCNGADFREDALVSIPPSPWPGRTLTSTCVVFTAAGRRRFVDYGNPLNPATHK